MMAPPIQLPLQLGIRYRTQVTQRDRWPILDTTGRMLGYLSHHALDPGYVIEDLGNSMRLNKNPWRLTHATDVDDALAIVTAHLTRWGLARQQTDT